MSTVSHNHRAHWLPANLHREHALASSHMFKHVQGRFSADAIQMDLDILLLFQHWPWKAAQHIGQRVLGLLMDSLSLDAVPDTSPWATRCQCISTSSQTSSRATWSDTMPPTWPLASWRPWRPGWRPRRTSGWPPLPAAHSAGCSSPRWVSRLARVAFIFNLHLSHLFGESHKTISQPLPASGNEFH